MKNYHTLESWGWGRDSSLSYSLGTDPISDIGVAGLRAIPMSDIYAQSRGVYGNEEHLAPAPSKCALRIVLVIYIKLSELMGPNLDASRNSRLLALGAGRGSPEPKIHIEDGGFSISIPGNLQELFAGARDGWISESLSISKTAPIYSPSCSEERLRADSAAAQSQSQILGCWSRFPSISAFPLLQAVAILLLNNTTPVAAKESKNLTLPLMGAEEKASALTSAQAVSTAVKSNTIAATIRRAAKSEKTAADAENVVGSVKKLVSTSRIALAFSQAPSEVAAPGPGVSTVTNFLDQQELVALTYAIFQGGGGDEAFFVQTADLLTSVGALVLPRLEAKPYEAQVQIILWACVRAGNSAPALASEMLKARDLVEDWKPKPAKNAKNWKDRDYGKDASAWRDSECDWEKAHGEAGGAKGKGKKGKGKTAEKEQEKKERDDIFKVFADAEKKIAGGGDKVEGWREQLRDSLTWESKQTKAGRSYLEFKTNDVANNCLPYYICGWRPFKSRSRAASRSFQGPFLSKL